MDLRAALPSRLEYSVEFLRGLCPEYAVVLRERHVAGETPNHVAEALTLAFVRLELLVGVVGQRDGLRSHTRCTCTYTDKRYRDGPQAGRRAFVRGFRPIDMGRLDDETVIVTGASRGLGASMAERFAAEGANTVLTARSEDELQAVADGADGETLVVPADVTDEAAVEGLVDTTVDEYGDVTGLVNNAGVGMLSLYDELRDITEIPVDDWRLIMEVNVTGAFLCAKHAVPRMDEGNVINISSGLGRRGSAGWGPYVASKWALEGFSRTLAYELEPEINVNCLDPGGRAETGFWDHLPEEGRADILGPDVMDEAAVLLLEQEADGVTAESMPAGEWETRLG